jgi:DNA-binding transcriptional ArsR family regulator
VTLWTAVHGFLAERELATRAELLERFRNDEESSVRGILNDLVESGLVLRTGRGEDARYRVATEEELAELGTGAGATAAASLAALVWLHVYREGPIARKTLGELVPLAPEALDAAIRTLAEDGRIRLEARGDDVYCATDECLIPVGEAAGWEAAVVDHHRTVLNAVAAKIESGSRVSAKHDEMGGTTLTFDLWPGHPREAEVRKLLATTRSSVIPLWDEVTEYNRSAMGANAGAAYQIHFYCGQYVTEENDPT